MTTAFRIGTIAAATTAVASQQTSGITTFSGDGGVLSVQTTQTHPVSGSIVDSNSNIWTQIALSPYAFGGTTFYLYVYTAQNIVGGAGHTVQASISGGLIPMVVNFLTFSGCALSGSLLDGTPQAVLDTGFVQNHPGASMSTLLNGSVLVQFGMTQNSASETFGAGSGFTAPGTNQALGSGATYITQMAQYQANVAANTYSAPWSTGGFNEAGSVLLALAPAAVAANAPPIYNRRNVLYFT